MKIIITILFIFSLLNGSEEEKFFWDEVKNSSDIELLKSYKQQYPNGIFEKIADIKIKRLQNANKSPEDIMSIPFWIKGTSEYTFYGVGKANKHFKGKHYQENLARNRARRELQSLFEHKKLTNSEIDNYTKHIEMKKYIDKRERIYILLYIDNYNL